MLEVSQKAVRLVNKKNSGVRRQNPEKKQFKRQLLAVSKNEGRNDNS